MVQHLEALASIQASKQCVERIAPFISKYTLPTHNISGKATTIYICFRQGSHGKPQMRVSRIRPKFVFILGLQVCLVKNMMPKLKTIKKR